MSKILFVMLHPGFIRYYEGALRTLADAGHHVHLAFEISRTKLGEDETARRLAAVSPRITCGTTPERRESVRDFLVRGDRSATRSGDFDRAAAVTRDERWESLATTVRLMLDYLRFFEPEFVQAEKLRDRAEKRLPRVHAATTRLIARAGRPARVAWSGMLRSIERVIPVSRALEQFVRDQNPDLLLVTPLIELGSQQVDYVKCARQLGIPSALCVASWDNLTSKGLIRVAPDRVIVWNEAQKTEAVTLHGIAAERVATTGAQVFDRWFAARPTRSREEFCRAVGLDPSRPFVLYVGSSMFIAPDEVPLVERLLWSLRSSTDAGVAAVGVLVRPHPANARQWRAFDSDAFPGTALWPPVGTDPNAPDFWRDYYESLYYSAAVIGINTSALIEAAIVGRPVFTITTPEFAHAQEGTLHFRHLVGEGGIVRAAASLQEHVNQLAALLSGTADVDEAPRLAFVRSFVRPHGLEVEAASVFARTIDEVVGMPRPRPQPHSRVARGVRRVALPLAWLARTLAEDRPLWSYALRPPITIAVRTLAGIYGTRTGIYERVRPRLKRARRGLHRARYEAARAIEKRWKRAQRSAKRALAAASSAERKG